MKSHLLAKFWVLVGLFSFIPFFKLFSAVKNLNCSGQVGITSITPPLLQPNDTIAVVAQAWWDSDYDNIVRETKKIFSGWGLKVIFCKSVSAKCGQFAGDDSLRVTDLQVMLDDPTIKAIVAYRGGYGTARIVDFLKFDNFLRHPKWVVGFSDITTLHLKLHKLGVVSIHGEMPKHFPDKGYESSISSLRTLLFNGVTQLIAKPHEYNRLGEAVAPVVGGNLAIICSNIGTDSDLDTKGKILVVEDVGEQLYALDRMMNQLKRAGKLKDLAGLVVGDMVAMKDIAGMPYGKSAQAIIHEQVAEYTYPIAFSFPIGHKAPNMAFLHGSIGKLSIAENSVSLSFSET